MAAFTEMPPSWYARHLIQLSLKICSADAAAKVVYQSKDGRNQKTFDALDWLAQLTTHVANKGESAGGGSDIADSTPINRVDCAKKPLSMIKSRP